MNKRAFTLIELLGSIVILSVIALIAFPSVLNLLGSSQNKIDDSMKRYVEGAARQYVNDNVNLFPKTGSTVKIVTISDLHDQGYVNDSSYNNQSIQSGCVKVSVDSFKKYVYEYTNECS